MVILPSRTNDIDVVSRAFFTWTRVNRRYDRFSTGIDLIIEMSFFIRDLREHIKELHTKANPKLQ
jgi:hypothetical protein